MPMSSSSLGRPGFSLERGIDDCRKKFGWPGLVYLLQPAFLRPQHFTGWVETDPPSDSTKCARSSVSWHGR
jgi:hypothetical protein